MSVKGATILVLEDETDLLFLLQQNLEQQGYAVLPCETLADAKDALKTEEPDLLLLDVNLPDGSGFDLLSALRREGTWTPAVFLTAKSDEADRLLGFAVGGDDYVVKPFSMAELMARLSAIVRRAQGPSSASYEGPGWRVDFDAGSSSTRCGATTATQPPAPSTPTCSTCGASSSPTRPVRATC
jgi:DNA-binding response OmpR family regulator